jgi:hypothetical protein
MIGAAERFLKRLMPVCGCVAALLLSACANTNMNGLAGSLPRPKMAVVSDFTLSADVAVLDRGYTARLERKSGNVPAQDRQQRTVDRVNDEIVATIVATLREAGLDAQPGSEQGLSLSDNVLVVGGRLRPVNEGSSKRRNPVGFGAGRSGVVADMTVSYLSWTGKTEVLKFTAEPPSGRKPAAAARARVAAARSAAIASVLTTGGAAPEKLSADVEAQARRLGRAAGERIVGYAKGQGWLQAEAAEAAPAETRVKLPERRPEPKPARKPEQKPEKPQDTSDEPDDSKS